MSETVFARITADFQATMATFGRAMTYTPRGGEPVTVRGFKRGLKPSELIGGFEQTDLVVTISAEGISETPKKFDRVEINGRSHAVMHANPLTAGDNVMGYKVFVRGGI